jgi:hypothetical protein
MSPLNRRRFLNDVGRGMLAAGVGTALASELGFSNAFADSESDTIDCGEYTRLVELMRNTPADQLQPVLAGMLKNQQTDLRQLTAAGALANAVTFGGCDYVGFHTAMALLPALAMSEQLESARRPLPVLKVLYRNALQIQAVGGASHTVLRALDMAASEEHVHEAEVGLEIQQACRERNVDEGEKLLASLGANPLDSFNALQPAIQDDLNVHRFVFAHRTYGLVGLLGDKYAHALLRQCVRLCADHERMRVESKQGDSPIRAALPRLLDQYRLVGRSFGKRDPGDDEISALCNAIYDNAGEGAAEIVAGALVDGIDPECIGEALSLASNQYVLRQRAENWRTHGDAAGVHSTDATNAWRNMLRTAAPHYVASGLIVAAYHVGVQSAPFSSPEVPLEEHLAQLKKTDAASLLWEAEDAIRNNDQYRAAASIHAYGQHGYPEDPVFALMLKYAVSEDGRLHGEKYYHTVKEEFSTIRPAFRWRQLVGLARVTASGYGYNREDKAGFRAAGYEQACDLLGIES